MNLVNETAKFDNWFAVYGNPALCKEAQRYGFIGRAHLASKGQNDPSREKSYRVTYLDAGGLQTFRYEMATAPKVAMAKVEAINKLWTALYAKRDERQKKVVE